MSAASLFLGACRARFYTPNRNPIPLFQEKGDVFADVSANVALDKYDITAGYAFTNGFAAYAGYSGAAVSGDLDSGTYTRYKYTGNMINLGAGYFVNKEISENFRFEIFADYGMGNFRNSASGSVRQYFDGNYQRIGVMPNIGFVKGNFSVAYSIRMSQLTFSGASYSDSDTGFWQNDIKRLYSKSNYMLMEQALQIRFGFDQIRFQVQFGAYNALNAREDVNAVPNFRGSLMLGIVLNTNILAKD